MQLKQFFYLLWIEQGQQENTIKIVINRHKNIKQSNNIVC